MKIPKQFLYHKKPFNILYILFIIHSGFGQSVIRYIGQGWSNILAQKFLSFRAKGCLAVQTPLNRRRLKLQPQYNRNTGMLLLKLECIILLSPINVDMTEFKMLELCD